MTEHLPASLDLMLRRLHSIRDAIKRDGFIEAIRYNADAQVSVRNEIDWSLQSDHDLPYILEFLEELSRSISLALQSSPTCRESLKTTIIEEIELLQSWLPRRMAGSATYATPDTYLDDIEIANKQQKYASILPKK